MTFFRSGRITHFGNGVKQYLIYLWWKTATANFVHPLPNHLSVYKNSKKIVGSTIIKKL